MAKKIKVQPKKKIPVQPKKKIQVAPKDKGSGSGKSCSTVNVKSHARKGCKNPVKAHTRKISKKK
jgi:hypothetical protein